MRTRRTAALCIGLSILLTSGIGCRPIVKSVPLSKGGSTTIDDPGVHYCLPKRLVSLVVTRGAEPSPQPTPGGPVALGPVVDRLELRLLPAAPSDECYIAHLSHSWWATDEIQLSTTPKGVLAGVNVSSEDETGDVIVTLAKTFVTIASLIAAPPGFVGALGIRTKDREPLVAARTCEPPNRAHYEFVFDPSAANEQARVNAELRNACLPYSLCLTPAGSGPEASACGAATPRQAVQPESSDGLLFRLPVSYRIRVDRQATVNEGSGPVLQATAELPNQGELVRARVDGSLLVRTTYAAKFDGGVLTEVKATKPSEVLAWVSLPLSVLGVVAGPVGDFLRVKVDYDSKHEDVVKAQRVVIEQQSEQLKAATKPGDTKPEAQATVPKDPK